MRKAIRWHAHEMVVGLLRRAIVCIVHGDGVTRLTGVMRYEKEEERVDGPKLYPSASG